MLTTHNLTITLGTGRVLVDSLTFSLSGRQHAGMIAEEGNGKSTLMKLFAGEAPEYISVTGSFHIQGKTAMLPQKLDEAWLDHTALEYLLSEDPSSPIPDENWNLLTTIYQQASRLRIPRGLIDADVLLKQRSGGEKVRLMMLKMLLQAADLYLLDEPVNDLDFASAAWIGDWIVNCPKPVLFISHDLALLEKCADGIIHLEARNKKTKAVSTWYPGGYAEYIEERSLQREKTRQLAAVQKREDARKKQRLNDLHNKVESALNSVPRSAPNVGKNLKDKMRAVKSAQKQLEGKERIETDSVEEEISFFFDPVRLPAQKIVWKTEGFTVAVPSAAESSAGAERAAGKRILIAPFDLEIHGQEKVVLIGENGCGKSTLLRKAAADLMQRKDLQTGYMPQHYEESFGNASSPLDFLQRQGADRTEAMTRLGALHFSEKEQTGPIADCSGGQKAKLYLASLALRGCNVLILDEPTRNLSPLSCSVLIGQLKDFQGCIIAASHDRRLIEECFERKLVIRNGRLKEFQEQQ